MKIQKVTQLTTLSLSLLLINCSSLQTNKTTLTKPNCYSPLVKSSLKKKSKTNRKPSSEEMNERELRAFAELKHAIDSNNLNRVEELLQPPGLSRFLPRRSPLFLADNQGNTLLHWAVGNRNVDIEIIRTLIKEGADVDAKNINKQTPIFTFIKPLIGIEENISNAIRSIEKQEEKKKEEEIIQIPQQNRESFRRNASPTSRPDILRLLIANGADLDARDKWDQTPLHPAAQYVREPIIITMLLETNPDLLEAKDNRGDTALQKAVLSQNRVTTKTLLEEEANPNTENNSGQTPLYFAVNFGVYVEITAELLMHDATISDDLRPKLLNVLTEERITELRQQK